ncbi:MAG: Haloacid dehalogenase [uncultured Sulfurovum sp.]|uniref:phosphoglycolate phosphatase n=1 Tax=uncultured Sulfurovum sp. TaxID=269237 RepID=A0A6S6TNM5_9BACT|nr:MAG: Haloacid dehalogenase [uncultured Sulfurovum sp.]
MSTNKKLIIFDMDGTLVDSSITIVNAINYVRSKLNLEALDKELILTKVNDPLLNPALFFYEVEEFSEEHEQWFSQYYTDNHEKELELYKGIEALLKELKEKNYILAIATNAYKGSTLESLGHLKILDYFSSIACYDDVNRGKPAPDMLEKNLKDLKLEISDAIFVGDSERDLMAANTLKMDYIMINWGFSDYEDAIHSIDKLKEKILEL